MFVISPLNIINGKNLDILHRSLQQNYFVSTVLQSLGKYLSECLVVSSLKLKIRSPHYPLNSYALKGGASL